tara:strand:+ start:244 stop:531 length:288 start_codon:yes stop_codon:yes gene_type:complete
LYHLSLPAGIDGIASEKKPNFYSRYPPGQTDIIYIGNNTTRRKMMLTIATILSMFVGFEGYDNGKVYFGVYTPQCEYGYVITPEEIYLDTIFEKN